MSLVNTILEDEKKIKIDYPYEEGYRLDSLEIRQGIPTAYFLFNTSDITTAIVVGKTAEGVFFLMGTQKPEFLKIDKNTELVKINLYDNVGTYVGYYETDYVHNLLITPHGIFHPYSRKIHTKEHYPEEVKVYVRSFREDDPEGIYLLDVYSLLEDNNVY